ncbi:DUF4012 domain-containing protein [Microbacterium sp. C7(2022)]|uniref:DUF4012 domain-containing protein n=1 Tax=Microbacterium sp. C7(2022) TaxID=2992759 RepID=UPI00237C0100|nr:DUF4012 domain-containing protein [Microbacterium sp. C7(2022)]MDE0545352.1 DUF4012 domain-containing protein [Microbacterium sp. C7(2022)]
MTESALPPAARTAGRIFAWVLAGILILGVVMTAWVGVRGVMAYGHLRDVQNAAGAVSENLSDPTAAAASIDSISSDTSAARALTSDPIWSFAERLPWIGPQLEAVSTVAAAADQVVSTSLTPLAEVASTFSLDGLRADDGQIDLTSFEELQNPATLGSAGVAAAAASVSNIDPAPLLAPVREAVDQVDDVLVTAADATSALAHATVLLPSMLGGEEPRDYLVLFQNNAEWRSLGGIPGAMALIHTDDGAMSLAAQESSSDYPKYENSVLPLGDEITTIYGERPGKWIQNVTQVPDFAVSAALAREMWALEHDGEQVDGVISLDPVALSYLLEATGPVELPTGDVLTSENAVDLLLNEVYVRYERPADQDAFFAAAAAAVFEKLSSGTDPAKLVASLARAGDEDRLLLWSAIQSEQQLIAETTLAGGLPITDENVSTFGAYVNDGTGSKMDYYLDTDVDAQWDSCSVDASGTAQGTATLTLTVTNSAPSDAAALPNYITGGGSFGVDPGIARTIGYLYLPAGFELMDATMSDDSGFGGAMHDGRRVLSFASDLASGEQVTATVTARSTMPTGAELSVRQTPTIEEPVAVSDLCG